MPDEPRRIGHFLVVSVLGRGATGEVVRARDERLGREVAIKTVRNLFGIDTIQFRGRFEAEARALAALSHPAIVQIYDLGFDGDEPYLVMELVDGPSLKDVLGDDAKLTESETRSLGIQLARALDAAHARGILHRDVKPANVLRAPDGQWKLADFGIARLPDSATTLVGQFLGTPAFAAPETLARGEATSASDVFALAITLAEAATGERVRGNASFDELIESADQPIVLPAGLSPGLARALGAATAQAPRDRPTAAALAELLARHDGAMTATELASGSARPAKAPAGPATRDLRAPAAPAPKAPALIVDTVPPASAAADEPSVIVGPPRSRAGLVVGIVGALALAGGAAALVLTRGGAASPPDAAIDAPPPDAPAPPDAPPPDAAVDAELPPDAAPAPKVIHVPQTGGTDFLALPAAHQSPEAIAAWNEVARLVSEGRFRRGLQALDAYDQQFGATEESKILREALADAPPDRAGWPP